jgi:hypothetical protein
MNQTIQPDLAAIEAAATEAGLYPCLCTILIPDGDFSDSGAPSGNYVAEDGLSDIPCAIAPLGVGDRVQPTELKEMTEIMSKNPLQVKLSDYYPQIQSGNRAHLTFSSGVEGDYEVFGVESDSLSQFTRLAVLQVTI